jgi:hypothetical protein
MWDKVSDRMSFCLSTPIAYLAQSIGRQYLLQTQPKFTKFDECSLQPAQENQLYHQPLIRRYTSDYLC